MGEEREGWAVVPEVTQRTAAPRCWVFAESNKWCWQKGGTFARHDIHIWVNAACFSQAGNGFVKRHGNLNNMLDSTFIQWEVLYKCQESWTHFSALRAERSQSEQVRSSANSRKNLIAAAQKHYVVFTAELCLPREGTASQTQKVLSLSNSKDTHQLFVPVIRN